MNVIIKSTPFYIQYMDYIQIFRKDYLYNDVNPNLYNYIK